MHIIIYIISGLLLLVSHAPAQNTIGLILNEPESFIGYTLFSPKTSTATYLINNDGLLINHWESSFVSSLTVYLLNDGHLLRSAAVESDSDNRTGGFQKFSWDNALVWEFYYGFQHHDIEALPNNNVLMLISDVKTSNDALAAGRNPATILSSSFRSLGILEIAQVGSDSGIIVWEWWAWDHLVQDFDETLFNYGNVSQHPELIDINFPNDSISDWLHTNSIDYHSGYDQIIISNRNTNEIWIIDHSTTIAEAASHNGGNSGMGGDILYRWGNPLSYRAGDLNDKKLFGQHDAHWIEPELNGANNIMIFNNGLGRPNGGFSTICEILPPMDTLGHYSLMLGEAFEPNEPFWNYSTEDSLSFFSPHYGSAQRLPNGNTIICMADSGSFFEITPTFDVVWKYINPVSQDGILFQGEPAVFNKVSRCYRFAPDYPGLINQDLTPGAPIEQYLRNNELESSSPIKYRIFTNYPNPFNPVTTLRYDLPENALVNITIYDIMGRVVNNLVNGQETAGYKSVQWDATNNQGQPESAGVYLFKIQAGNFSQTKKMVLLK